MADGHGRILILDDDESIRDLVARSLGDDGYEVIGAASGEAALSFLTGGATPDLILLDWRMQPMSGRAFAEAYHRLPGPHAPVVVITAAGEGVDHAVDIGASGYLRKPFDLQDLADMVARFVPGARSATQPPAGPGSTRLPGLADSSPSSSTPPATSTRRAPEAAETQLVIHPGHKVAADEPRRRDVDGDRRLRQLRHLGKEVQRLRDSLAAAREETRLLLETQDARALSAAEARRLRRLRQESERMHLELQSFWSEFEALRASRATSG